MLPSASVWVSRLMGLFLSCVTASRRLAPPVQAQTGTTRDFTLMPWIISRTIIMLLAALLVSLTLQVVGFYLGCKNQCLLTHKQLKTFLVLNRFLFFALYTTWVLKYGKVRFSSIGLILIAIGQYINLLVYKKLGADFVYYGREYGMKSDYITEFPFTMRHPQYIGTILTTLGVLFITGFEKTNVAVLSYMIALYGVAALIENDCRAKTCDIKSGIPNT